MDPTPRGQSMYLSQMLRVLRRCLRHVFIHFFAFVLILGMGDLGLAGQPYDNPDTPEGWAFALIKKGKEANFNDRCRVARALDARAGDDLLWNSRCRRLEASFLVDLLTKALWHDQVPFTGIHIIGARIVGDLNLRNAKLD